MVMSTKNTPAFMEKEQYGKGKKKKPVKKPMKKGKK